MGLVQGVTSRYGPRCKGPYGMTTGGKGEAICVAVLLRGFVTLGSKSSVFLGRTASVC